MTLSLSEDTDATSTQLFKSSVVKIGCSTRHCDCAAGHLRLHVLRLRDPALGLIKDFGDHRRQFCQPLPRELEPSLLFVCTLISYIIHQIMSPA